MNRSLVFKFFGVDAGAGREFDKMAGKAGVAHSAVGKLATGALVAGAAVGVASIGMAMKFQTAMTGLVTGAGESEKNIKGVGDGILKMSGDVGTSADELAKGMYLIESAGYHGASGLKVLKAAAEGAKVGQADMATVADGVTSALNAYHLPASKAVAVTNQLIVATKTGKMHMQDLAGALGNILPSAAALHVPLAQVVGGIATMTMQGTKAAKATTAMRFLLSALVAPASKAKTALKGVGLSSKEVGDSITKHGLPQTLQMITDAVGKKFPKGSAEYIAAMSSIVGGTRGMTAALEMTGTHLSTFETNSKKAAAAGSHAGSAVKGWALVQQELSFKLEAFKSKVEALAIGLGQALLPAATKVVSVLSSAATWISHNSSLVGKLAVGVLGLAAGFKLYALTVGIVNGVTKAWAAIQLVLNAEMTANPIGLVVVAVAALAVGLIYAYKHSETFRKIVNGAFHGVMVAAKATAGFFTGPFLRAVGTLVNISVRGFKFLADAWFTTTGIIVHTAASAFGWLPGGIGDKLKAAAKTFDAFRATVDGSLSALAADARGWGSKTGANLALGVSAGLAAYAGQTQNNGLRFGMSVANAIATGAKVKSPSRITIYVGKMLAEGLVVGFQGASAHVLHKLDSTTQTLVASIGGRIDHWLGQFRAKLLHARDKLRADLSSRKQMAGGIRDSLVGGTDITGAFGQDANGDTVLGNVGTFLSGKLGSLKRFLTDLRKLRKMGLAPRLLSMIANAGPDQGIPLAEQMLSGAAGSIGSLNGSDAGINSTSAAIGNIVAGAQYDGKIHDDRKAVRQQLHELKQHSRLLKGIIEAILASATTPEGLHKALLKLKRELGHDLGLA